ncbi:MAG: rRNA maturation RNase YbeY [Synechococcaceae cyanobacterium]|nr:rRNA maturation RNase YbeY [Synechococcaceae cyanobacterium]
MSAPLELDLVVEVDGDLAPALRADAGTLACPQGAAAAWTDLLGRWLAELAAEMPAAYRHGAYSLSLQIGGDGAIAALNGSWRGRPEPTDVLAFAAQEGAPPQPIARSGVEPEASDDPLELGDIVVSLETAARQAAEHGHSLAWELRFLVSHGLLHLLGWDHPDEPSLAAMLARQERLLQGDPGLFPPADGARVPLAGDAADGHADAGS